MAVSLHLACYLTIINFIINRSIITINMFTNDMLVFVSGLAPKGIFNYELYEHVVKTVQISAKNVLYSYYIKMDAKVYMS
jgi:hypothetical protein